MPFRCSGLGTTGDDNPGAWRCLDVSLAAGSHVLSEEVSDGIRTEVRPSAGAFHRLCAGIVPVDHAHGSRGGGGLLASGRLLFRGAGAAALGTSRPRGGASDSQLGGATSQADAFAPAASDAFQNRLGINIPWWVWVLVAAGLVFYLTYWGIRLSTNAGIVLGIFEIVAFLALGLYMIFAAGGDNTLGVFNPANSLEGTWSGVFKGMVFSILAFIGFEAAAPLGEEARNPRRTIPRVVIASALVIGLFYLVCAYASVMGWGFDKMASYAENPDPWTTMATRYWGVGWIIIFLAIANSAIANANAGVNAATRVMYAMGRINVLPRAFGRTHPEHRTPYVAIITQSVLALVVALVLGAVFDPVGGFSIIATAVTIVVILVYMTVCASTMVFYLRERRDQFNILLHGVFPTLAILMLLAPLYYQFAPLPDYPVRLGNYFAIIWIVLGFVALGFAAARRPQAIAQAEDVFVEDETADPRNG